MIAVTVSGTSIIVLRTAGLLREKGARLSGTGTSIAESVTVLTCE